MSRESKSVSQLPDPVRRSLAKLGESLAIARVRRKQSQKNWASRIGVSVPTLIKMEKGEPTVSMAVYATAIWMMGKSVSLESIASPEGDLGAMEMDVRSAIAKRVVRKDASILANLAKDAARNESTKDKAQAKGAKQ